MHNEARSYIPTISCPISIWNLPLDINGNQKCVRHSFTSKSSTALAGKIRKAICSFRLSVRLYVHFVHLFPLHLVNRLTFELVCACVGHDRSLPGIESQGRRTRSKVNVQRVWVYNAVTRSV